MLSCAGGFLKRPVAVSFLLDCVVFLRCPGVSFESETVDFEGQFLNQPSPNALKIDNWLWGKISYSARIELDISRTFGKKEIY